MDGYLRRLTTQPEDASFPDHTLPPFQDFVFIIRAAPPKELTDLELLRKKLGDILPAILDHRFAWMRGSELRWVDDGLQDEANHKLREILQSEAAAVPSQLRQAVSSLEIH